METILIAGGTGLIGKALQHYWKNNGHEVRLLTRGASHPEQGVFQWNPLKDTMDEAALTGVTVLVNLSGAGVGEKRWTAARRQELFDSRVRTTECLWQHAQHSPTLRHYLSASGAVCYGFENDLHVYTETDPFGTDLLSVLTRDWEQAIDLFSAKCLVTKMRTGVVFSPEGGALVPIAKPIRMGFGSVLGSGKQVMPWIHIDDLIRAFDWVLTKEMTGVFNVTAGNTDNKELTHAIARMLGKRIWLPPVPGFVLRLMLGKMSELVLKGLRTSNEKLKSTGFAFVYEDLDGALRTVFR